jgi:undecaprenyl diphosphate synthase
LNSSPFSPKGNDLDTTKLPTHVAVIMDGNGRWAKKRFLNRIKGHEKGSETVRMIVRTSREIGIKVLTLYAFSTENWQRPQKEVTALMSLLKKFLNAELATMLENNIRLNIIGQMERLPQDVQKELNRGMSATRDNDALLLNIALSYGGRDEILHMTRILAEKAKDGLVDPAAISAEDVTAHLYTRDIPDPDLLIRTSGEMRISNFLLWQIAYTEIYVTETLWPDFKKEEYIDILRDYQKRERRFGKV